jgi:lysophospholipase L1-like esterase
MTLKNNSPKGKKLLLFKVFAFLLPLLLLVLLEIGLRVFNYGHNTSLFVKSVQDDRYMVMNYYASEKYFSDTLNATKGSRELFAINKAPNTVRIFVLGESTTVGYPYFHNGSFHRWLLYRLMQMYPGKNFEIINLSLTAVNSYTVLDFGKQLPQYQPNAVLIYTGHNEYYGAMGVGSTSSVGSNRFMVQTLLKLRELKTVQLLNRIIKKVGGVFSGSKIDDRETLMKRMAAKQEIPYQSADFKAGINQYEQNMTELCQILSDNKIPVFLSNVVSNEKDLPPFVSASGPQSASNYYKVGQQAYEQAHYDTAKQYFDKARELDELRFRAPDEINTIIESLAAKFPDVHLVDTKKAFEQYSPHNIIGKETILEHVHPNLYGYSIMSEAFYQAIQQQHLIADEPDRVMTLTELQKEMPVTRMDSLNGQNQINMLKTGWPFNEPSAKPMPLTNEEDSLAAKLSLSQLQWSDAMNQLFEYYKRTDNKQGALQVMEGLSLEFPLDEQFMGYAANLNAILGNYDKAAFYFKKLYMLNANTQVIPNIFQLYLKADEPDRALPYIQYLPPAQQALTQATLTQIVNDKQLLVKEPGNVRAKQRIAAAYKKMGADDVALKYSK